MPIETYKDENGQEQKRYISPSNELEQGDQESGEKQNLDLVGSIGRTLAQGGRNFAQNIYDSVYDEIATYNPADALDLVRNPVQAQLNEIDPNKQQKDEPGIIGRPLNMQPTSFDKPDAPLPFYGKPLPEFAINDAERFIGDLIASVSQFIVAAKGIKKSGLKHPNLPFKSARTKELLASSKPLEKIRGRFYRGAQEGYLPGALNDYFLEDPWKGNLASLLEKAIPEGAAFTPVKESLNKFIVDDNDTLAEAKAKNTLVGTFIAGPLLGGSLEQLAAVRNIPLPKGVFTQEVIQREGTLIAKSLGDYLVSAFNYVKKADKERGVTNPFSPLTDEQIQEMGLIKGVTGRNKETAADQAVKIIKEQDKAVKRKDFPGTTGTQVRTEDIPPEELGSGEALRRFYQEENKLKTVLARTKHIAEAQGGLSTTKSVDLQPPSSGTLETVDIESIKINPEKYQFKRLGQTPTGQSGSLADAAVYNPDLAGVLTVYRDPVDGQTYMVNGHNRFQKAKKSGQLTVNVRYIDAASPEEARVKGAMQNIAEGQGTPTDAAKIMRDTKMGAEEMIQQGITPSGVVMRKAIPLSKLPQALFDQVTTGQLEEGIGIAVGSSNAPDQVMFDLAKAAKKRNWSAAKTAEAASVANEAVVRQIKDPNALPLPGFDTITTSDFEKKLEIRMAIRAKLRSEINALGVAANTKKAGTLQSVGNVINVDASKTARQEVLQGEAIFKTLSGLSGPLSKLINELSGQVKGSKRAVSVVESNIQKIKNTLKEEFNKLPTQSETKPEPVIKEIVTTNPTSIGKKPNLKNVQILTEQTRVGTINTEVEPELPRRLKQSKAGINYRQMKVFFNNDIDHAIYVVTKRPNRKTVVEITGGSKNNQDYINFLMNDNGLSEQDIIRVADSLYDDFKSNYTPGTKYTASVGYKDLGIKSGQLSLDPLNGINPFHRKQYGTLGNDYTGMTLLNYREKFELLEEIQRMAGEDVNIKFVDEIQGKLTAKQAKDMGLSEGTPYSASGEFVAGGNPADDLIIISMFSKGGYRGFTKMLRTTFHESFHRLQKRFLTKKDLKALEAGEKEIRELAAKTVPEFRDSILDGTVGRQEVEAMAFSDWYLRNTDYPKATWAEPFKKIAQIIERTGNFLKGRGYQTWDDVFERAMRGEIAEQGMTASASAPVRQLAIDPPDAEELAKNFAKNRDLIKNGDMSVEEAGKDGPRRLISRSGKTRYVGTASEESVAVYKTFVDAIYDLNFNKAEATGMPTIDKEMQAKIFNEAIAKLREDGMNADELIINLERALKGNLQDTDDFVAIKAIQMYRDMTQTQFGVQAQKYLDSDDISKPTELNRLKEILGEHLKINLAYMSTNRKDAQRLAMAKLAFRDDIELVDLPARVTLRKGTSKDAANKVLKDGFDMSKENGALGNAIYFTTDVNSIRLQDGFKDEQIYGDMIEDIKIADLTGMNKRITDLLVDLKLGQAKRTKNGIELTPKQIEGIKQYLEERGYAGIRYEPRDTGRPNAPADEVVIFDTNSANRIVGSDASVVPQSMPETPKRTLLEQAISKSKDIINDKLDAPLRDAIENGVMTPDAREIGDIMVAIASYAQKDKAFNGTFTEMISKVPDGQLTGKRLLQLYRSAILMSGSTWWKMMFGGLYRAALLPSIQAQGGFITGALQSIKGDKRAAYLSFRRAKLSTKLYGQYYYNLGNALRLMKATIIENETFGNLGIDRSELTLNSKYSGGEQIPLGTTDLKVKNKNDIWHVDPNNKNWLINPLTRLASTGPKIVGRLAGSVDTLVSTMIGPSQEYIRFLEEAMYKAEMIEGLRPGSKEHWEYATEVASKKIKDAMVDVVLADGKIIKNAALTGDKAKNIMDYLNFTDPLDAIPAPRTYDYGVRAARESGLTDPVEIHNYAKNYVDNPQRGKLAGANYRENFYANLASKPLGGTFKALGDMTANQPYFGLLYPLPRGPVNIIKAGARSTGIGAPFVDTFWRDLTSEDLFARDRAIGDISNGVLVFASLQALQSTGLVEFTGFRSGDYRERIVGPQGIQRGIQPFSVRFKNPFSDSEEWSDYFSLLALDTLSNAAASVGELVNIGNSVTKEQLETAGSMNVIAIAHLSKQLGFKQFTKSVFTPIIEIFDLLAGIDDDSDRLSKKGSINALNRFIYRKLSSLLVPSFVRQADLGNPMRQPMPSRRGFPINVVSEFYDTLRKDIAGFNEDLPPELHDYTGLPIMKPHVIGTNQVPADMPWLRFTYKLGTPLNGFVSRTKSTTAVDVELSKLHGKGSNYRPWHPNIYNLPGRALYPDELNRLKIIGTQEVKNKGGKTMFEELTDLVTKDPSYAALPYTVSSDIESARMNIFKEKVKYYIDEAKKIYREENEEINAALEKREQAVADRNYIKDNLYKIEQKRRGSNSKQFLDQLNN